MSIDSPFIYEGNIITTRVRIARNIWGYPFVLNNQSDCDFLINSVKTALDETGDFELYKLKDLSDVEILALKEKHIISQTLIDNKKYGAFFLSKDESVSIMVNEEDLLRQQCFMKGLRLFDAYKKIDDIDNLLSKHLNFAFDEKLGYLTACPTNVGTGLRASVMMFLPALFLNGKINKLIERASKLGITVRGIYGEGSNTEGYMFQISNELTLGLSENNILQTMEDLTVSICDEEREEIEELIKKNELLLMDKAKKSYGYLTNSIMLTYPEFLSHIGNVKLGAMLGMIDIEDIGCIDNLIVSVRPAIIQSEYGKKACGINSDILRSKNVRRILNRIKE